MIRNLYINRGDENYVGLFGLCRFWGRGEEFGV